MIIGQLRHIPKRQDPKFYISGHPLTLPLRNPPTLVAVCIEIASFASLTAQLTILPSLAFRPLVSLSSNAVYFLGYINAIGDIQLLVVGTRNRIFLPEPLSDYDHHFINSSFHLYDSLYNQNDIPHPYDVDLAAFY